METLGQQAESSRPHMQLRLVPQKQSQCLDISIGETQEGRTQQYRCCKATKVCNETTWMWQQSISPVQLLAMLLRQTKTVALPERVCVSLSEDGVCN